MNIATLVALLLLTGGLMQAIPPIGKGLTNVFGGTPVIQIAVGIISIIVGLIALVKKTALSS